jgi:hypothetical protein
VWENVQKKGWGGGGGRGGDGIMQGVGPRIRGVQEVGGSHGDVMTRMPTPESVTATNLSEPVGPPQATDLHPRAFGVGRFVHVIPSGLVMTLVVVLPMIATATKVSFPAGPAQVTLCQ